ncbi:MAG: glycosyltransferase [Gammaproteobacteria bacterium]|nr:glycosyltransferase [Gammaproteobacteria bacterium]
MIISENSIINVLHIVSGDLWAGAEVQLFTLVKALNKRPDTVVNVIVLNHGTLEQKLLEHGINVVIIDEKIFSSFDILLRLIRAVKDIQPDVIHTHRVKENILGSIAALVNGNIPSLRTAHGAAEHKPAWYQISKRLILYLDWLSAMILQSKIIAVSSELSKILKTTFPDKKVVVIENGIDIESLPLTTPNPLATHSRASSIKICFAGRLVPIKRIDLLILTARFIKETYPNLSINFHIYGDGPLKDDLKRLNIKSQTENIVHFEGHCDKLHAELKKMDALLLTSDHEGLPMILLEAMALKIPIIAHATGGIPDLLNHGKCGFLVNEHTAQGYAKKILQLYEQPEESSKKTLQAFVRVNNLYSGKENANKYSKEYKKLIK